MRRRLAAHTEIPHTSRACARAVAQRESARVAPPTAATAIVCQIRAAIPELQGSAASRPRNRRIGAHISTAPTVFTPDALIR